MRIFCVNCGDPIGLRQIETAPVKHARCENCGVAVSMSDEAIREIMTVGAGRIQITKMLHFEDIVDYFPPMRQPPALPAPMEVHMAQRQSSMTLGVILGLLVLMVLFR